jgi:small subunit ribosomal protein S1
MSTNLQRHDLMPPPLEEGYWDALLREGEFAEPVHLHHESERPVGSDEFAHRHPPETNGAVQDDWATITEIMERDEVITLPIIGYNRGGLLVEWHSLRGFVPASQLVNFPATAPLTMRRTALAERIGQTLNLRVIELNHDQNRFILSERAARVEAGERA